MRLGSREGQDTSGQGDRRRARVVGLGESLDEVDLGERVRDHDQLAEQVREDEEAADAARTAAARARRLGRHLRAAARRVLVAAHLPRRAPALRRVQQHIDQAARHVVDDARPLLRVAQRRLARAFDQRVERNRRARRKHRPQHRRHPERHRLHQQHERHLRATQRHSWACDYRDSRVICVAAFVHTTITTVLQSRRLHTYPLVVACKQTKFQYFAAQKKMVFIR